MNTGTIYDVTTKEYMSLGKIGDGFFTGDATHDQIIRFLTRIVFGHEILIFLDSKGQPEGFYNDGEHEKWTEIETDGMIDWRETQNQ